MIYFLKKCNSHKIEFNKTFLKKQYKQINYPPISLDKTESWTHFSRSFQRVCIQWQKIDS